MTTLLTEDLIARCHAGSKAKGFWPEGCPPDQRQQLMLMAGELAEAQEAHRKGWMRRLTDLEPELQVQLAEQFDPLTFDAYLKDHGPDELADAFIRGCDFAGGFGLAAQVLLNYAQDLAWLNTSHPPLPENFGAALYAITADICRVAPLNSPRLWPDMLANALVGIQRLAEREDIDLAAHIDLKLRFNATRPAKHGKAY